MRLIACQSHLTFEVFLLDFIGAIPQFLAYEQQTCTAENPAFKKLLGWHPRCLPKTVLRCFLAEKTGGITHGKIDDLQMRVGVSGQTLWAVNEGA